MKPTERATTRGETRPGIIQNVTSLLFSENAEKTSETKSSSDTPENHLNGYETKTAEDRAAAVMESIRPIPFHATYLR